MRALCVWVRETINHLNLFLCCAWWRVEPVILLSRKISVAICSFQRLRFLLLPVPLKLTFPFYSPLSPWFGFAGNAGGPENIPRPGGGAQRVNGGVPREDSRRQDSPAARQTKSPPEASRDAPAGSAHARRGKCARSLS